MFTIFCYILKFEISVPICFRNMLCRRFNYKDASVLVFIINIQRPLFYKEEKKFRKGTFKVKENLFILPTICLKVNFNTS